MKLEILALSFALIGMATANTCPQGCSNDALCCCCETTHKIPGGSGYIQSIWTAQARCLGQTCDTICNSWLASDRCDKWHSPAGFQPCQAVGKPANAANSNFQFYTNQAMGDVWSWESSTIEGVVVTPNGVAAWQNTGINVSCFALKNNGGYKCFRRPSYSACILPGNVVNNIDNAWGFE